MSDDKFGRLRQMLMEKLDMGRELSDEEILEAIDGLILTNLRDSFTTLKEKVELRQELFYSVRKLDVLQELIEDETVTEIMVNGAAHIFYEKQGVLYPWEKGQLSEERLRDKDKRRAAYHRFYTNMKWGHAQNYHLTLDSGVIGIDKCVDIIAELY